MALNLRRLLATGRRVARLVRDLQRTPSPGRPGPAPDAGAPSRPRPTPGSARPGPARPGPARSRPGAGVGPGGGSGGGSGGEVPDYPGDFRGAARVEYDPVPGAEAGPGEVVWTWVPFEELDGRGKDRPVLVVGRHGRYLLAVQLTSRDRNDGVRRDDDHLDIGTGAWDARGRASEARLDRILQVDPRDVRREGGVLAPASFERVAHALRDRNGWA